MRAVSWACFALLCCWNFAALGAGMPSDSIIGRLRPAFDLPDIRGNTVPVSRWNGRIILLNFWATWCAPCRKEIPLLNTLQKDYAKQGVQIVGVALDDSAAVKKFIRSLPIDYPVLIGGTEAIEVIEAYGDDAGVLPYTVFIDRRGVIDSMAGGALTENYARRSLDHLLQN